MSGPPAFLERISPNLPVPRHALDLRLLSTLVGLALAAGCRLSLQERPAPAPAVEAPAREAEPAVAPPSQAKAASPAPSELEKAIADLEATGKLDSASREKLLADLRQTDPALWPEYLTVFRSVLEYQDRHKTQAASPAGEVASAGSGPTASRGDPAGVAAEANRPAVTGDAPAESSAGEPAPRAPDARPAAAVQQAAHQQPLPEAVSDWRMNLDRAIDDMARKLEREPDGELASRLGLLRVAADRRDEALRSAPGLSPDVQAYWSNQLYALATFLEARRSTAAPGSEAEAVQRLRLAVAELAESAPLVVRNPHFCTEVSSYGVFKPFDEYRFEPGQEVLLYAEIENFKSRPEQAGHHTAFAATYRILDAQGREAIRGDLGRTEETCRNVRRDYFVRYFLAMPEHLYDGKYTLQLTIEDLTAKKVAQATIELLIERGAKQ